MLFSQPPNRAALPLERLVGFSELPREPELAQTSPEIRLAIPVSSKQHEGKGIRDP